MSIWWKVIRSIKWTYKIFTCTKKQNIYVPKKPKNDTDARRKFSKFINFSLNVHNFSFNLNFVQIFRNDCCACLLNKFVWIKYFAGPNLYSCSTYLGIAILRAPCAASKRVGPCMPKTMPKLKLKAKEKFGRRRWSGIISISSSFASTDLYQLFLFNTISLPSAQKFLEVFTKFTK